METQTKIGLFGAIEQTIKKKRPAVLRARENGSSGQRKPIILKSKQSVRSQIEYCFWQIGWVESKLKEINSQL